MFIGNFGANGEDGRLQLLIGITPQDLVRVVQSGGQLDLNKGESADNPLPARLILMFRDSDDEIEKAIDGSVERVREKADQDECDHDWEVVGDHEECTYGCGAVRPLREGPDGEDDV